MAYTSIKGKAAQNGKADSQTQNWVAETVADHSKWMPMICKQKADCLGLLHLHRGSQRVSHLMRTSTSAQRDIYMKEGCLNEV
jgi:hypothetical protein